MQTKSLKSFLAINNLTRTNPSDIEVDACGLALSLSQNTNLVPQDEWQCDIDCDFIMISKIDAGGVVPVCYGQVDAFLGYLMKREAIQ